MSSSLQAASQDTELVRRHSRWMRKVKHLHDEIVGLLGQRAAMSGSENKLHLAQNHPEMLLQERYAEHAADFTAKMRKACSEAYQQSKAKKQRGLPGVEGEAVDALAAARSSGRPCGGEAEARAGRCAAEVL